MTIRKQEKATPERGSYRTIISATANNLNIELDFVEQLVNLSLEQDLKGFSELQATRGENFNVNSRNALGNCALHILFTAINEKTLPAILFLLERGASFAIKNRTGQTPFHLLAINGASSVILDFWQSTEIWNFLRNIQEKFDIADDSGKTFLHYLMLQPGDELISVILEKYFRFRCVDKKDIDGNTPLHLAAQFGNDFGVNFYLSLINEEYVDADKNFIITNNKGETPADLARSANNTIIARKLYRREFIFTSFHDYLTTWLQKQNTLLCPAEKVESCKQKILTRIKQLAETIIIAPSEINDSISEVFQVLGIQVTDRDNGIEVNLRDINLSQLDVTNRREVYKLTSIGRLEWMLRDVIINNLLSFAQENISNRVDAMQEEYNENYNKMVEAYEAQMNDFSDGDLGYDYEGAIRPKSPKYTFNRKAITRKLEKEFAAIDKHNLKSVLNYVPVQEGVIAQKLYDGFIDMDLEEYIIEDLNKSNLGIHPVLLSSLILSFDFKFRDLDISKDGFLVDVIEESFNSSFSVEFSKVESKQLSLEFIEACCRSINLIDDIRLYNQAAARRDSLALQQTWMRMQPFLNEFIKDKSKNSLTLRRSLSTEFNKITQKKPYIELSAKTNSLIKVFPTDESRTVYYDNGAGNQSSLDLKPLFKTLQTIAKSSHDTIVKYSKTQENGEKTNVITAYLLLVVTAKDDFDVVRQKFIRIPLVLNVEKKLLSKDISDGIFSSEHEFHTSAGEDRQRGADITQRAPKIDVVSAGETAKQQVLRIMSCLNISDAQREQFFDILETAQVDKPLQLDYELQSDVQQTTLFNHSERVLFKALKIPSNVKRIVDFLYNECELKFTGCLSYQVELGCLLLYSYPNSVCDECGLGLIATQNSEQEGFIRLLIQHLQSFHPLLDSSNIQSQSNTFTVPIESTDQCSKFTLTTIVASEHIFHSDSYANILNKYPSSKIDLSVGDHGFFSTPGISLSNPNNPFHFYEFVETDLNTEDPSIPYGGSVTMSGSKASKFHHEDIGSAEKEVADNISQHDAKLGLQNS